jgi:hypothetical protein
MAIIVCHSRASRALARSFLVLVADVITIGVAATAMVVFMPAASHLCGRQGLIQVNILELFRFSEKPGWLTGGKAFLPQAAEQLATAGLVVNAGIMVSTPNRRHDAFGLVIGAE